MSTSLRAIGRALGSASLMAAWVGVALGGVIDEVGPGPPGAPAVAGLPDPRAEFVNLVSLLLAVSLSMLAYGYLFDGPLSAATARTAPSPSDQAGAPRPSFALRDVSALD